MTNIINISEGCPSGASSIIPKNNYKESKILSLKHALSIKQMKNDNTKVKYSTEDIDFITSIVFNELPITPKLSKKLKELMK